MAFLWEVEVLELIIKTQYGISRRGFINRPCDDIYKHVRKAQKYYDLVYPPIDVSRGVTLMSVQLKRGVFWDIDKG